MNDADIQSFLEIEPIEEGQLETPVPVVDLDVVDRNVRRWQARCDELGIANRPHIKTHKLVGLARFQIAVGAKGITVQKLGEAEVMADGGITDMLHDLQRRGRAEAARASRRWRGGPSISVVADSPEVVAGLGQAGREAGRDIAVLVECETGAARNGVQSPGRRGRAGRRHRADRGPALRRADDLSRAGHPHGHGARS